MQYFVVMGVTGCGKTTVAELIAQRINATFIEADELHGDANISKMASGQPLSDDDRWPWLQRVADAMKSYKPPVVVSCSALRQAYRDYLREHTQVSMGFIHLHSDANIIAQRMAKRSNHFMPIGLLDSQLQLLEHLEKNENGVVVNIDQSVSGVVDEAMLYVNNAQK